MAEHLGNDDYRVVDISVQRAGGSAAHFIRYPKRHRAQLDVFFERTGRNYTRFNYLGEWHSHPSCPTTPSGPDVRTMRALACDPAVGSNFLVLLIVRLGSDASLESSATIFRADDVPARADLMMEPAEIGPEDPREMTHALVGASAPGQDDVFAGPAGHAVHGKEGD